MATTPEGKVKEKARKLYRHYGAACFQPAQMGMGSNGTPDQLACRNDGHFGGVETKAGTWRVSALQRIRLEEIATAGGSSMVVRETNLAMLEQWLKSESVTLTPSLPAYIEASDNHPTTTEVQNQSGSGGLEVINLTMDDS